jgi:[ribosomal protein S5]-alanine N-acetyltransferase
MTTLQTARLLLVPITLAVADAALQDRDRLPSILGYEVPDEWPNPDFREALSFVREDLRRDPGYSDWSRVIVHAFDNVLIGDVGFKSKPDSTGTVEIGYGVVSAYRNRGIAFEASSALIDWIFNNSATKRISAECLQDNEPSIRVLQKLGMEMTHTEETADGTMLKWSLAKTSL